MASESKNTFHPEEVMAGILLTTCEPVSIYQLSKRLYSLKEKDIDVSNISNRRCPNGFFSADFAQYVGWMEFAGLLDKKSMNKGYVLNSRGLKELGSMLGKAYDSDNKKYSKLLAAINS
jgi:hypothetical protein